jgi:bacterioferritin-associated ferredoxin
MKVSVGLPGRDQIDLELEINGEEIVAGHVHVVGCLALLEMVNEWKPRLKGSVRKLPVPIGVDHASLLLKELILRVQGVWNPPYKDEELCHCRGIPTERVNQAITSGCHTPEAVSRVTSASTACGTCRPDVVKQITYFLKSS